MALFYTKFFTPKILILCLGMLPTLALAFDPGDPPPADSLAGRGHCKAQVRLDTICATQEITISAYIFWTWTGVLQPVVGTWNTGQVAHKITVAPPGTWSWDPTGTTCEEYHWGNEVTLDFPFFEGPVEISGPTGICPNEAFIELNTNLNYYSYFEQLDWSPENPAGDFEPFPVSQGGTYGLTVTDALGCTSSDQVTIVDVPIITPGITGPVRLCPEGEEGMLSIVNPALYESFEWDNGEVISPITITEPGTYQVTATDVHGCTGTNSYSVQSGGVDPFDITATSPSLCPGQLDTLRVLGAFSNYSWSNNATGITNIVNQAGTYTVTVTNLYGCTGTSSTTIAPILPPVIQVSSTPLCLGDTSILVALSDTFPQYLWSSGQTTRSITVLLPGTYTVTVSGVGVCTTSTATLLDLAAAPTTIIDPAADLTCIVLQTPLVANNSSSGPNYPFFWTTPDGHFVSGDSTLNPIVDEPGTYILSIRNDTTGCYTNDTIVVNRNIIPPPADAGLPAVLTCAVQDFEIGPVPPPSDPNLIPAWSSPDGNIVSGNNSWDPNVDQPGLYLVTVTDALNGCTSTDSVVIGEDVAAPMAQIAPTNLITCMTGMVPLDGSASSSGPGFTYLWSTSNGILAGPTDFFISGAAAVGTYDLLVTNTQNGCTATASVTVAADVNIPIVSALAPNTLNCSVLTTVIDASASSSGPGFQYQWTTQNGNIVSGGNTLNPTVDAPGTYTLNLLDNANNCTATLAVTVTQDITPPLADAGQDQTLNCSAPSTMLDGTASATGANYSYNWSTSTGNIVSGNNSLNPTVDRDGTYILQVTDTSNGCTSTASVQIMNDANAPEALIAAPATLNCTTLQTLMDASGSTQTGNLSYVWSGNPLSGQGTLQAVVDQPGTYSLTITDNNNGCTDVAMVTVAQDIQSPTVLAGPDVLLNCFSPTANIGDAGNPSGPGFTLQWTTTGGNFSSGTDGPTVSIDQPGDYQLFITNLQNGCTATDNLSVSADFVAPLADAGPSNELNCVQTALALQGTGSVGPNFSYLWTTTNGNLSSGANSLNPTVDAPGLYQLLVTNTQNGCTAASQVIVTEDAVLPTAFAGMPQTLTCTFSSTTLSAAGSSTGPDINYAWSAGNGGNITSGANTLTPAVDAPGTYIVTVTNTQSQCTQTSSVTILENVQTPVVDAGLDNTLTCVVTSLPLQAQILSSSSQSIGYQWATPNGQILSGANTPSPGIGAPGNYLITVTDMTNGCTGTDQLLIQQDITPPTALVASPQTLTCSVTQITLNATASSFGANFIYSWSSPTGNIVSQQDPQQPVVDAPGPYQLLLTNTINGCTQMASVMVSEDVVPPSVEAGPVVGLDCDTQTNTLNSTGSSQGANFSYTWSTTNGQIVSGANSPTPTVGDPGNYVLTILNTQNGCSNTDNVVVVEDVQQPGLAIAPPPLLTCLLTSTALNGSGTGFGNSPGISWTTSGGGNIVSGGNSLAPIVDAPGNYTLTVLNTGNGCSNTLSITVPEDIQTPPVQVQPAPLLTCSVQQFALQSTVPAQASVAWTTSTGNILSGANTPNPTVDEPGLYTLTITSPTNGCTNSAQINVQQEQNVPVGLDFKLDPPLCNGTPGLLSVEQVQGGVGPLVYSIDGGQTFIPSTAFNGLQPGSYELVIQDANGCELVEMINVPSPPIPVVNAPSEFEIALGENQEILAWVPITFPLSLVDTVIWNPMDGLTFEGNSTLELLNPMAQPFSTTQYSVTILTKEGCKSTARTIIKVDRQADIYVPNVIWPDDPDSDNATFLIFARDESIAIIKNLQIFDRWGSLLFSNKDFRPNDPSAGWDGKARGEPVNPAVFIWYAEIELVDGRLLEVKGDVTVVR